MKTSKLILNAVLIAFLSIGTLSAQDSERTILRMSEITVKQGHYPQFTEGVKKWKECYGENNGERGWNMWERVQGEGSVFVMTGIMQNWAEMDKEDPANKECYAVFMNFIMPHVEKVNFNLARTMPDISRTFPEDAELVWVWSVKVNNSTVFKENLESMSKAIVAREGKPRGVWYSFMGGAHDAPDYMVSVPFKAEDTPFGQVVGLSVYPKFDLTFQKVNNDRGRCLVVFHGLPGTQVYPNFFGECRFQNKFRLDFFGV